MDVYIPQEIGEAELSATNVPTPASPREFDATRFYLSGEKCREGVNLYEALADVGTTSEPSYIDYPSGINTINLDMQAHNTRNVLASVDNLSAKVFNLVSGQSYALSLPSSWSGVEHGAISADGSKVVVRNPGLTPSTYYCAVCDVGSGSVVSEALKSTSIGGTVGSGPSAGRLALSSDGAYLAAMYALSSTRELAVYSTATSIATKVATLSNQTGESNLAFYTVHGFTPDDAWLVATCNTSPYNTYVFDTATWTLQETITGLAGYASLWAFSSTRLAALTADQLSVKLFDTTTWSVVATIALQGTALNRPYFSADEQHLLVTKSDGTSPVVMRVQDDAVTYTWAPSVLPDNLWRAVDDSFVGLGTNPDTSADAYLSYELNASTPSQLTADAVGVANAVWLDLGAINAYRMFDGIVGSATVASESYDAATYNAQATPPGIDTGVAVTIEPGAAADTLTLLGVVGTYLDVIVRWGVDSEFTRRTELTPNTRNTVTIKDIGADASAVYYISVYRPDGDAEIGNVLLGESLFIGNALEGMSVEDADYSRIVEDEFGYVSLERGNWSSRVTGDVVFPVDDSQRVFNLMADLRATNAVWIASAQSDYAPLTVFGFRRRFSIAYTSPSTARMSVELRGLV